MNLTVKFWNKEEKGNEKWESVTVDLKSELESKIENYLRMMYDNKIVPNEVGFDILITAICVYIADLRISREKYADDNFTRQIKLEVPVKNLSNFNSLQGTFTSMLTFLTGDLWEIKFKKRTQNYNQIFTIDNNDPSNDISTKLDTICLFSGGIDSLIGALNKINNNKKLGLISFADPSISTVQRDIYEMIQDKYKANKSILFQFFLKIKSDLLAKGSVENSTRGRSFLFLGLACFVISGLKNVNDIIIPENGFISINVPIDELRLGAYSTRTTHPYYLSKWNEIIEILFPRINITNPYQHQTKADMIDNCQDKELLTKLLPFTRSCSSIAKSRFLGCKNCKKGLDKHIEQNDKFYCDDKQNSQYESPGLNNCGYCMACLIRRAAIHSSSISNDTTQYEVENLRNQKFDTMKKKGRHIYSLQNFVKRYDDKLLCSLAIHKQGPLNGYVSNVPELADMFYRGVQELKSLIKNIETESEVLR